LWENFIIAEKFKHNEYTGQRFATYFWRTTDGQEIDLVEERDGRFYPTEFKWNPKKGNVTIPRKFRDEYNPETFNVVTPENYLDWLEI